MKYWIDIKFKNETHSYYEYDELVETNNYIELYRVDGFIFKKRTLLKKLPKISIMQYEFGRTKR